MHEVEGKHYDSWTASEIRQISSFQPAYAASMVFDGKKVVSVEFDPGIATILIAIGKAILEQRGAQAAANELANAEARVEEMIRSIGDIIRSAIDASVIARLTSEVR